MRRCWWPTVWAAVPAVGVNSVNKNPASARFFAVGRVNQRHRHKGLQVRQSDPLPSPMRQRSRGRTSRCSCWHKPLPAQGTALEPGKIGAGGGVFHFTAGAIASTNSSLRFVGCLPLGHVQQIHEEIVAQHALAVGKHAILAASKFAPSTRRPISTVSSGAVSCWAFYRSS